MAVTIYDVASFAHVSVTTISKILNHKDFDISDETRERVLAIIKELDFTPSGLARSLVTKKTNVLGLLIPDISNQYFADMARGVEDGANRLGYNVILCNTDENHRKELEYLHLLQEKGTDGIIIVPIAESEKLFTEEFNYDKPFVILDRVYENMSSDIFQVRFDNVKGGYFATRFLTQEAHKRIGIITGPSKSRPSKDRLNGYKAALAEAGIPVDKSLIYEGNFKFESGFEGAKYLLKQRVSAIFATNDIMACGVYKAITSAGLKIPNDISVMGYDDIMLSDMLDPPLSTISQPKVDMGRIASEMLIKQIKKEKISTEAVFEPKLIKRKSVRHLDL